MFLLCVYEKKRFILFLTVNFEILGEPYGTFGFCLHGELFKIKYLKHEQQNEIFLIFKCQARGLYIACRT